MSAESEGKRTGQREWDAMNEATLGVHPLSSGDVVSLDAQVEGRASVERGVTPGLARPADEDSVDSVARARLLFWVKETQYSGALVELREAVPVVPFVTAVPLSPAWLLGVFPMRTELVTLVDPRPFLAGDGAESELPADGVKAPGSQALLIGENGRLVGLIVDRIGDITGATAESGAGSMQPGADGDTNRVDAIPLDLAALYINILAKLEAWTTHV